jgi:hypothetical protein
MRASKESYSTVCAFDSYGYIETNYFIIRDIFIESKPEYWEYLNPRILIAFFAHSSNGKERAQNLISQLEMLKSNSSLFNETGIGYSEGSLIVGYDKNGKVVRSPIGMAVSEAMKLASKNNSVAP